MTGYPVTRTAQDVISARGKKWNRILWTLQVITAISFFIPGLSKLIFYVDIFDDIGWGQWFQYLTGTVQIVGSIALLIPRLSGLAGLALAGFALSALGFHLTVLDFTPIPITVLGTLSAIIAWGRRDTIKRLLGEQNKTRQERLR